MTKGNSFGTENATMENNGLSSAKVKSLHQMEMEAANPAGSAVFYDCQRKPLHQYQYKDYADNTKTRRNSFVFWAIVVILLLMTVGNLVLTLTVISVLHMGKGMRGIEFILKDDIVKFHGDTDLDRIFSKNIGQFEGFVDEPVVITGEDAAVYVRMHHRNTQMVNRMTVDKMGMQFRGVNSFEVNDPTNGSAIFTTHRPHYKIPLGAEILLSKTNSACRIASPINKPLVITSSDNRIYIKGSQSIATDSEYLHMQAENDIKINSTQGGIYLEGGSTGIYIDITKFPIVNSEMGLRIGSVQYKLCVCMPLGNVFRIAIPRIHNGSKVSCAHFSGKHDPCLVN